MGFNGQVEHCTKVPGYDRLRKGLYYHGLRRLDIGRTLDGPFWQARYYDPSVRDYREFMVKLRSLHRNPVKRGLVVEPEDWKRSSSRHYALQETGVVEIKSE
jgi:hypothetical protein